MKVSEGRVETYESFDNARAELSRQEEIALPRILTALSCNFSSVDHPVSIVPIERVVAGKTKDGRTIRDWRLTTSAVGYVSRPMKDEELEDRFADAIGQANTLNARAARFYRLALFEDDSLKRFCIFSLPSKSRLTRHFLL